MRQENLDCDCVSEYAELCPTCQQEQLEQDIDKLMLDNQEEDTLS